MITGAMVCVGQIIGYLESVYMRTKKHVIWSKGLKTDIMEFRGEINLKRHQLHRRRMITKT